MALMLKLAVERNLLDSPGRVLEVGSLDVNGSYRQMFKGASWFGIDMEPGPGVDRVANLHDDFGELLADGVIPVDLVVSGQQLEHDPHPWLTVQAMVGAVWMEGGTVIVIAPWDFPYHHAPDFYRFSPEGLGALALNAVRHHSAWEGKNALRFRDVKIKSGWGAPSSESGESPDAWCVVTVPGPRGGA